MPGTNTAMVVAGSEAFDKAAGWCPADCRVWYIELRDMIFLYQQPRGSAYL